jgi:hypothetical protein
MNPHIHTMLQPVLLESAVSRRASLEAGSATSLDHAGLAATSADDRRERFHVPAHSPSARCDHPPARVRGHQTTRPPRRLRSYR